MAANLSPLAGAAWQFFSNSGLPLAGGKLYTYLAGSTTPQASYTTSTGLVANTNPIILNSAGRLDNEVWLPEGVSYKFVLNTPLDVTLGTYDNIKGINDFAAAIATAVAGVYASFSGSSGSSLVGYIASGTGAVAQTVQSKLRQTFNVKDYGAVGDGVTDDTLAIQRTITASDGVIIIPAGTFMITGITLTAGKQLIGLNRATSILKPKTALAGNGMINSTSQENIVVENLTIDGGSLVGTKNGLINFYGCHKARIENNNFINTDQFAIACNSMNYAVIRGNVITMSQLVGAWIDTSTVVPGSGGPASASGLVGTISAPAGVGGVQAAFTYGTTAGGAVDPATISFSNNGRGYLTNPTASFPAVPGSSCTARYGGAQVVAITYSGAGGASPVVGEGVEISHNYIEGGGCNLTLRHSNIFGNVARNIIYGAAFVSEQAVNVGRNVYSNNVITRIGYCTVAGASYTNTYIGPDTDNTVNSGFELWGAYEECLNNICYFNAASGISFGAQGGICSGNTVYDNGQYWATLVGNPNRYATRGIQIPAGNATYNGSYSLVSNNRSFDQNGASGTQGYGIGADYSLASPLVGLKFVDNDCFGNRLASYIKENATVTYFRGRRIEGRLAVDPASIAPAGAADYSVTVPGMDTGNWLLSSNFIGLTTEPMMSTTRYTAVNQAAVRIFNFSASAYDLPSGSFLVQAEEVIA
jgi:hypothetical protein